MFVVYIAGVGHKELCVEEKIMPCFEKMPVYEKKEEGEEGEPDVSVDMDIETEELAEPFLPSIVVVERDEMKNYESLLAFDDWGVLSCVERRREGMRLMDC
jgi:hypothetical protein